jgi:YidC/Oxa1 family membrane protein insertase
MKSITYENHILELYYEHEDGKSDYLGLGKPGPDVEDVSYIAYKQHFFSSILLTKTHLKSRIAID